MSKRKNFYDAVPGCVIGKLRMRKSGKAYIKPLDGSEKKVLVEEENLNDSLNGDIVQVKLFDENAVHLTGEVEKIIRKTNKKIFGVVTARDGNLYVEHKNKFIKEDLKISPKYKDIVGVGSKVMVKITDRFPNLTAKIFEIKELVDPKVNKKIFGEVEVRPIKENFPAKVLSEVKKIETEVNPAEILKRVDRRNLKIVTMDGEDAKDLDDAVFAKKIDGGYFLGVYIADVSYYVKENSAIDLEALERGTSIYLVNKVIPMLPLELSNGICSLYEKVDRLVMACEMNLDLSGNVTDYKIFPATIHVQKNLFYSQVNDFFDGKTSELENFSDVLNSLKEICDLRKKIRDERGAIEFDFPETKIKIDDAGKPVAIEKKYRRIAERIIEECMLVANETVAYHTVKNKIPSLYRVHDVPSPEKLQTFNRLLSHFGTNISNTNLKNIKPKDFQAVLTKVKLNPAEKIISRYALRTMKNAGYWISNDGHFGLAAKFYTHFTSPIRRYPDLIVHRMIRANLEFPKKIPALAKKLSETAKKSSACERQAEVNERDDFDKKAAEFMKNFIGKKFDAMICGLVEFGFFVELDNGVSGLVPAESLHDDFYNYVEKEFALIGKHTGRSFHIGDSLRVKLIRADSSRGQITFELVEGVAAKDLITNVSK